METRRYMSILLIFMICLLNAGCNGEFTINQNISGKTLEHKPTGMEYYIKEKYEFKKLIITYKQRNCLIYNVKQNSNKKLTVLQVNCSIDKNYIYVKPFKKIMIPKRCILLISGNRIIYKMDLKPAAYVEWLNNNNLLIVLPYEKIIINERGKIIKKMHFKKNQLKSIPATKLFV